MTPYRRLIMLACMADNPGADPDKLRREFICRVLADHPFVACQIFGAIRDQAPSQRSSRRLQCGPRRVSATPSFLRKGLDAQRLVALNCCGELRLKQDVWRLEAARRRQDFYL